MKSPSLAEQWDDYVNLLTSLVRNHHSTHITIHGMCWRLGSEGFCWEATVKVVNQIIDEVNASSMAKPIKKLVWRW